MKQKRQLTGILLFLLIYFASIQTAFAETILNNDFILDLDSGTPIPTRSAPAPTSSSKQGDKQQARQHSTLLGISTTQDSINFGFIVAGEPIVRSDIITLTTQLLPASILYIAESNSLASKDGSTVPDTSCDSGGCSHLLADVWNSPLTFGFGYRCDAGSCVPDFGRENSYKALSRQSSGQEMTAVGHATADKSRLSLLYKINLSANLASKPYTNTIQYILTPSL